MLRNGIIIKTVKKKNIILFMEFLKLFRDHFDYEMFVEEGVKKPNVSLCFNENELHYNERNIYEEEYFTLNVLEGGSIVWKESGSYRPSTIYLSFDDGESWEEITSSSGGTSFDVYTGDKIRIKGNNSDYAYSEGGYGSSIYENNYFSNDGTAVFEVEGNIMSLISGDSFMDGGVMGYTAFGGLFSGNTKVVNAKNLVLPTTVVASCYHSMFMGCTNLLTAPKLPATSLSYCCYYHMFSGCENLKKTPELPATELGAYCYSYMFDGCTKIEEAPALLAENAKDYCYSYMFKNCTSLTTTQSVLPPTTLNNHTPGCYKGMFYGCVKIKESPLLPTERLGDSSYVVSDEFYREMFYGCSSLEYVRCYLAQTYKSVTKDWLTGVANNGVFVTNYRYSSLPITIPAGWTLIYYEESEDKYYLDYTRTRECDDHGNEI